MSSHIYELWSLIETDKPAFVEKMQKEQKIHEEQMRANIWGYGNAEYGLMQTVWSEFHQNGGKRESQTSESVSPSSIPQVASDVVLPFGDELPKSPWRTLMLQGATPFERLWGQLATDKLSFIGKMDIELKKHIEWKSAHPETPTGGNVEYMMMQWVWHLFHTNGETRVPPIHLRNEPPPPPSKPCAGQSCGRQCPYCFPTQGPVGVYAVNPSLTQTRPNPQVVQWVQGNRIIMRPENREVMPGESMSSVRIHHRR